MKNPLILLNIFTSTLIIYMIFKWQIDYILIKLRYGDLTPTKQLDRSRRNISNLTKNIEIKREIENIKVVFTKKINQKNTRGYFIKTFFNPMIFIDINTPNIQNVIEHELLHALDDKLSQKYNLEDIIYKNHKPDNIYNFMLRIYKKNINLNSLRLWSVEVYKNKEYYLSYKEMFVLLNNMRIYMLKKKMIKLSDEINAENIQKLFQKLEDDSTDLDFIPLLPFLKYNDNFYHKLNSFYKTI